MASEITYLAQNKPNYSLSEIKTPAPTCFGNLAEKSGASGAFRGLLFLQSRAAPVLASEVTKRTLASGTKSPVKLNAPGPQGAVPAGIERSSAVLNRISDSGKARGDTSSTTLRSRKFYILVENQVLSISSRSCPSAGVHLPAAGLVPSTARPKVVGASYTAAGPCHHARGPRI